MFLSSYIYSEVDDTSFLIERFNSMKNMRGISQRNAPTQKGAWGLDTTANKESMLNISQMTYSTLNNSQI
jgi:hypothetical protein